MNIETTIHIHKSILEKLNTTAEITGKSRTSLVACLMQRVMHDNHRKLKQLKEQYKKDKLEDERIREEIIKNKSGLESELGD